MYYPEVWKKLDRVFDVLHDIYNAGHPLDYIILGDVTTFGQTHWYEFKIYLRETRKMIVTWNIDSNHTIISAEGYVSGGRLEQLQKQLKSL